MQIMALMRLLHDRRGIARVRTILPLMPRLHDNIAPPSRRAENRSPAASAARIAAMPGFPPGARVLFVKTAIPSGAETVARRSRRPCLTGPLSFEERVKRPPAHCCATTALVYAARPPPATASLLDARIASVPSGRAENEDIPTPTFYIEMRAGYSLALATLNAPATAALRYNGPSTRRSARPTRKPPGWRARTSLPASPAIPPAIRSTGRAIGGSTTPPGRNRLAAAGPLTLERKTLNARLRLPAFAPQAAVRDSWRPSGLNLQPRRGRVFPALRAMARSGLP